jgi:hypothetical protein
MQVRSNIENTKSIITFVMNDPEVQVKVIKYEWKVAFRVSILASTGLRIMVTRRTIASVKCTLVFVFFILKFHHIYVQVPYYFEFIYLLQFSELKIMVCLKFEVLFFALRKVSET